VPESSPNPSQKDKPDERLLSQKQEQNADVEQLPCPQLGILQSLANNLFCDAAIQSMGLVILGEALTKNEKLSAEDTWYWHDFMHEVNADWRDFTMEADHIGHIRPEELNSHLDFIISTVQARILKLAARYPGQVVAGTLRLCLTMVSEDDRAGTNAKFNMHLMWIRHIAEE